MEQTNFYSACPEALPVGQILEEVEVNIESNTIGKVLCFNTNAKIDSVEALQGEAIVSGTLFSTLIYLNEVGNLKTQTQTNAFTTKIENANINPMSSLMGKVEVVESNITYASENKVLSNVTLELALQQIAQKEVQNLEVAQDRVRVKTDKKTFLHVQNAGTQTFNVMGEENIKLNTNEVFVSQVSTSLKSVEAGTGYFTITGEVNLSFVAQSQDEDKPIKCFTQTYSFKEEIEDEKITKNDIIWANVSPIMQDINVEFASNDGRAQFGITIPQSVSYVALYKEEHEIAIDAFSLDGEVELEQKDIPCSIICPTKYLEARVDGNFSILDSEPRIAKIACVSPNNLTLTKTFLKDDALIIEGLVSCCVSYETDDDETMLGSVQTEVPFSCNFKNIDCNEDSRVFVIGTINNATAKAKKGKEIDLDLDLSFKADLYSNTNAKTINKLLFGEAQEKSEYPLQVYIAPQGSTLWDLSKKLKATEEQILRQNNNLVFPLETPTSIVYFRGK